MDDFVQALARAAAELPPQYLIWIEVDQGRSCIGWTDPDGNPHTTHGEGYPATISAADVHATIDAALVAATTKEQGNG